MIKKYAIVNIFFLANDTAYVSSLRVLYAVQNTYQPIDSDYCAQSGGMRVRKKAEMNFSYIHNRPNSRRKGIGNVVAQTRGQ